MKPYKLFILVLSMLMTLLCSCDGFIANHSIPEHSPGMPDKTTTNRFSDYDKFPLPYETALKVSSDGEQLILSKQQALEDYDALWEMLEDNYPYFETIKNELGLDWREVRDTYRTELISVCRGSSILQDNYIIEASNPVPTPLLGHRCRSSQEITGSPTPFSTSKHYLWICASASFSLSNPNIAA